LFHPAGTHGISPFRAFPSRAAAAPSGARCPLVVNRSSKSYCCSPSGPYSARESVGSVRCFHRPEPRCSLGASSPFRAFTLLAVAPPSRRLLSEAITDGVRARRRKRLSFTGAFFVAAANHLHAQVSRCPTESQRAGRSACLSRVLPALLGFLASHQATRA
jgi:hypothetical protein